MFKTKKLEELLFSFSMNLSSKKDFLYFNQLLSHKFYYSIKFRKVENYFQQNYTIKLREKAKQLLNDENIIDKYDEKYLPKCKPEEMLENLKSFLRKDSNINVDIIKGQFRLFINDKKSEKIESELFFYLYIIKLVSSKAINIQTFKISPILNISGVEEKINELVEYSEKKKLNYDFIQPNSLIQENVSNYSYLIKLLQIVEKNETFELYTETFQKYLSIAGNYKYSILNMFYEVLGNYLLINKLPINFIKEQLFTNENISKQKNSLIQWFFEKVSEEIFDINDLFEFEEFKLNWIDFLNKENYPLISKLFLLTLLRSENVYCIKEKILFIKDHNLYNSNIYLKFSMFAYICCCHIQIFNNIKKIDISQENCSDFNIIAIFYYIHNNVQQNILIKMTEFSKLLHSLYNEDNNIIDVFKYINKTHFHLFGEENIFQQNEKYHLFHKDKFYSLDNEKNIQKLIHYFNNLQSNAPPIIFFQFTKWINKDIIDKIHIVNSNHNGYYELNGIYIIDQKYKKWILLFDKYSKQWKCICNYDNKVTLKINELYLVYFHNNKDNSFESKFLEGISHFIQNSEMLFDINDRNLEKNVYWKTLKYLEKKKPKILERNKEFLKNVFNIDFEEIKDKLFNSIKNQESNEFDINVLDQKHNELLIKEEMLTEQIEFFLYMEKENFDNINYFLQWMIEQITNKNFENMNHKLKFYFAIIFLLKRNTKADQLILNIFTEDSNKCLKYENIEKLTKEIMDYSKENDINQLIKRESWIGSNQNNFYTIYIKIILFLDNLLQNNFPNISEELLINQLNELFDNKDCIPLFRNSNVCVNLIEYLLKKFFHKKEQSYYNCLVTLIDKLEIFESQSQNEGYALLKTFIVFIVDHLEFLESFAMKYLTFFSDIIIKMISKSDFTLLADLIMFVIDNYDRKQQNELFDKIYWKIENILKSNFTKTNPILQYAIVSLCYFFKIKCINTEKQFYKQIKQENSQKYLPILLYITMKKFQYYHKETSFKEQSTYIQSNIETINNNYAEMHNTLNNLQISSTFSLDNEEKVPVVLVSQFDGTKINSEQFFNDETIKTINKDDYFYEIDCVFVFDKDELISKYFYNKYGNVWIKYNKVGEFEFIEEKVNYDVKIVYIRKDNDFKEINFGFLEGTLNNRSVYFSQSKFKYLISYNWIRTDNKETTIKNQNVFDLFFNKIEGWKIEKDFENI